MEHLHDTMPISFQMVDGLIMVRFHGRVTGEDLQRLANAYDGLEKQLEVTPDRITDLSDWIPNTEDLPSDVLNDFGRRRAAAKVKNRVKSAIIVPKPEVFGLARMYQVYNTNPNIETMVFADPAIACAWVGCEAKVLVQKQNKGGGENGFLGGFPRRPDMGG